MQTGDGAVSAFFLTGLARNVLFFSRRSSFAFPALASFDMLAEARRWSALDIINRLVFLAVAVAVISASICCWDQLW